MEYGALIQNRKSVRAFKDKAVAAATLDELKAFAAKSDRLADVETELLVFDCEAAKALEGACGYENVMIGAPTYLVLLSADHEYAVENGGYVMEDVILKATELDLNTCWITFTDGAAVAAALGIESDKKVVAVAAVGYGEKTTKRLRINIKSMSNVDVVAERGYFAPKKSIYEMVCVDKIGNTDGLDVAMGFYNDMLWNAFYACSLTPSYLNRQPYTLVLKDASKVILVANPDEYTDELSAKTGHGIVMRHFDAIANLTGWTLGTADIELPEGYKAVATYSL
ncbi:MAG: nitroreductase family protein [Firmicutes bacterium]|nr:nitroreductase family protein [Bacillota bacterium]